MVGNIYNAVKLVLLASIMLTVASVFANGADDTLITFSTKGVEPDRYADGTVVLDNECYALVWSKDGIFEGIRADGAPVDSNDKIVLVAAVAHEGHCPEVVFQISAARASELSGGKYGVILLDTRINKGGKVVPRGTVNGKLTMVNGFGEVADQMKVSASEHATIDELLRPEGQVASKNAAVAENIAQPRIKHIWIEGNNVFLKVENMNGFMRVQGGSMPDSVVTMGAATQTDGGDNDVILVAPKMGNSGFYKVLRN